VIKNIVLENIGSTDFFKATFNKGLNVVKTHDSETLAYSLGYITNNFPLCKSFPTLLKRNSNIRSSLNIDEEYIFDMQGNNEKISSLFDQSREEDNICFYKNGKFKNFPARLSEYKDFEFFYTKNRFSRETNGACLSRTFRGKLTEYIRNFKPQKLNPNKAFHMKINENGEFFVDGNPDLSASEANLFDFLCFLNIIEFWENFEEIKDLNHIKKPIVITELFEMIDESIPKDFILKRLENLNRQIFLIERK
jgi:hypothetical protein